jgi:hypothetical protein
MVAEHDAARRLFHKYADHEHQLVSSQRKKARPNPNNHMISYEVDYHVQSRPWSHRDVNTISPFYTPTSIVRSLKVALSCFSTQFNREPGPVMVS